ncbi:MAG: tRNA lysidine(34) synthetase TilS [Burkholderiaceae bacterium]
MASSRTRPTLADPLEALLIERVRAALAAAQPVPPAEAFLLSAPRRSRSAKAPVIVALSGGRDSVALLDLVGRVAASRSAPVKNVVAVHVHHGLSPQAEAWAEHCRLLAERLGVGFELARVKVRARGHGIEAAARLVRYEALAAAAHAHGARIVLAAHHLDDRLETFLIQWMRGAGADGLAGFPAERAFADGSLRLVRPFIDTPRIDIEAYVAMRGLAYVDDDSNEDTRLLRNALRLQVLPVMDAARPGFRAAAARSIDLVAEAADVLRSVAEEDLAHCVGAAATLRVDRLLALPVPRQALVLRAWLASHGVEPPARGRLLEALRQVREARSDARLLVRIGRMELRRFRAHLVLREAETTAPSAWQFEWKGESEMAVPVWGGVLHFTRTDGVGFDSTWLAASPLELRGRAGGERFKPEALRPSKTLKRLFQEAAIPEFERARLPLLWRGDDLIFVAGLGADARRLENEGDRVAIEWRADRGLIAS